MLTISTETLAQFASKSHGTWMPNSLLMIPKLSFRRPAQMSRLRKPGIAYGTISTVR